MLEYADMLHLVGSLIVYWQQWATYWLFPAHGRTPGRPAAAERSLEHRPPSNPPHDLALCCGWHTQTCLRQQQIPSRLPDGLESGRPPWTALCWDAQHTACGLKSRAALICWLQRLALRTWLLPAKEGRCSMCLSTSCAKRQLAQAGC